MTKEQLRNYQTIKEELRQIEQKLRCMEKHSERDMVVIQPLRECYTKKLDALVKAQLEIERAIDRLDDPTERMLVRYRYIDGLKWHVVARRISYELTNTHRIHARVLKKFEKLS